MKRYLVVVVCFWLRGVNVLGELVTMVIPPSVTNPSITQNNEDHYVFYDTDVLNYVEPSVFVMLPGTYGRPYNLQSLLHRAITLMSMRTSSPSEMTACIGILKHRAVAARLQPRIMLFLTH